MAIIGLEGMRFNGPHGFYPEEEIIGNDFLVDVYISVSTRSAAFSDDLNKTVNYETVYLMVQAEMKKSAQLIETLADRIVFRIDEFYEYISGIKVIVRKLNPPLGGQVGAAYIELTTGDFKTSRGYKSLKKKKGKGKSKKKSKKGFDSSMGSFDLDNILSQLD